MRKMPAIDLLVRFTVGPQVLKNAQSNDSPMIKANCIQGKKGATYVCKNKLNYRSIVQPTPVPIKTPSMHDVITKMRDSQKQSIRILYLVKPIALNIPTSFFCSYRLADILAAREKKQRNIVTEMSPQKTLSRIDLIKVVLLLLSQALVKVKV